MNYVKLGDIVSIRKGKKFEQKPTDNKNDVIRFIQIDDLRNNNNIKLVSKPDKVVFADSQDIIIAWDGANAGTVGYGLKGVVGSTLAVLTINKKIAIEAKYLGIFLRSKEEYLRRTATGATIPHIQRNSLMNIEVPIPNLNNQHKIMNIIDASWLLIEKRKEQLTEMDRLIQSVFYEMFGDPCNNNLDWETGRIKDVIIKTQYGTSKKASIKEMKYPMLRMNNITYSGKLDYSSLKYIDLDENEKEKYLVRKGEVLFNRTNSKELVGKTAMFNLDEPMAFAGYLIKMIPNEKVNGEFLSAYMNTHYIKSILLNMAKSIVGMANINAEELKSISIYIPPIELQNKFATIVEEIESQKKIMEQSLTEMENHFNALLQKAFKGELFSE